MPVILNIPADPAEQVQPFGEQMRNASLMAILTAVVTPILGGSLDGRPLSPSSQVAGLQDFAPMNNRTNWPHARLMSQENGAMAATNAVIATPCGALVQVPLGRKCYLRDFVQDTTRFAISGQTKDSTGAALGDCRVVCLETGRIGVAVVGTPEQSWPVVGETVSDGSGNYTVPVALNTGHTLIGYKPGSPDVAGITRNDVAPTAVG